MACTVQLDDMSDVNADYIRPPMTQHNGFFTASRPDNVDAQYRVFTASPLDRANAHYRLATTSRGNSADVHFRSCTESPNDAADVHYRSHQLEGGVCGGMQSPRL